MDTSHLMSGQPQILSSAASVRIPRYYHKNVQMQKLLRAAVDQMMNVAQNKDLHGGHSEESKWRPSEWGLILGRYRSN
jgi:hypothetical protein